MKVQHPLDTGELPRKRKRKLQGPRKGTILGMFKDKQGGQLNEIEPAEEQQETKSER